ncbi:hypothetical protein FALCPG4_002052 [Fusarium falciforme]
MGMNLGQSISSTTPGDRVIGVRHRMLRFEMPKKNRIDASSLEDNSNRWEMFTGGDWAREKNVMEANLEDELGGDLECDEDKDELAILEAEDF